MQHSDKTLQMLRVAAMAAVGLYMYQVWRKQGSLNGVMPNPGDKLAINTDRVVDTVMPWLNINPIHKQMISSMAKETLRGYMEEKGVVTPESEA